MNRSRWWPTPLLPVLLLAACDNGATIDRPFADDMPDGGSAQNEATPDAGSPEESYPPVPARWPDDPSPVTHDVDTVLGAVLERPTLATACDDYERGARDRTTILRCGKKMFFEETFGTVGIPADLMAFDERNFEAYFGANYTAMGFVADPDSDWRPIGLWPTTAKSGPMEGVAFTCAGCHFGRMPDGRYAVGYANMSLDYGRFLMSLGAPISVTVERAIAKGLVAIGQTVPPSVSNSPAGTVHPDLKAAFTPLVDARLGLPAALTYVPEFVSLMGELMRVPGGGFSSTEDDQARFLRLRPGTMDFLTKPMADDGVWTVSRTISIWNLPELDRRNAAGMPHEMLSWTGGGRSLMNFLHGFTAIGTTPTSSTWTDERLHPLEAYVYSLRSPPLTRTPDPVLVARGARVFQTEGCQACHSGPSGESIRAYSFDEIGTDPELRKIFNPDANGNLCCGFSSDGFTPTRGVKAPRLAGQAFATKQLHNGAVASLESLLCLAPRDPSTDLAQMSIGHRQGCNLPTNDRLALIAWLRTL